jgi:hypothetical protein
MKKMGKFERQARRQEYQTALGILAVIQEHIENDDMGRIKAFVEIWDKQYTEWLENMDQDELKERRYKEITKLMRSQ